MITDSIRVLAQLLGARQPAAHPPYPPSLPLLEHICEPRPADWLRMSMTTFAESVASFLPGHFEAYARVYHPFEYDDDSAAATSSWRELSAAAGADPRDPAAAEAFAFRGVQGAQARVGRLPTALIQPLLDHLKPATTTPERCFFAIWEGHGGLAVPPTLMPTLELPHRRYHIFAGPIEAIRTNFSAVAFDHQSANLWWPADQAWCVATEVDFAWTYVGGARSCIRTLLGDPRFEAVKTTPNALW